MGKLNVTYQTSRPCSQAGRQAGSDGHRHFLRLTSSFARQLGIRVWVSEVSRLKMGRLLPLSHLLILNLWSLDTPITLSYNTYSDFLFNTLFLVVRKRRYLPNMPFPTIFVVIIQDSNMTPFVCNICFWQVKTYWRNLFLSLRLKDVLHRYRSHSIYV